MASFTTQCGSCGKKYKIGDPGSVGKKTKCKACGELMVLQPVDKKTSKSDEYASLQSIGPRGRSSARQSRPSGLVDPDEREALMRGDRPERLGTPASDRTKVLISIGGAFGLVFFMGMFVFVAVAVVPKIMVAEKVEPPTELEPLDVHKFPFRIRKPPGWPTTYTGGSGGAAAYVKFEKGAVKIEVDEENPALRAEPQPVKMDRPDLDTVAGVHNNHLRIVQKKYRKYSETPGERYNGSTSKRISTFTYNSYSGKMKGLRITILNSRAQLYVMCICPEKDFEAFEDSFHKIVETIRIR